jgi:SAM-dependent methyltransferase
MEDEAIRQMAAVESRHWWFVGRRSLVAGLLDDLGLARPARILEAGCGTGGNLEMLGRLGEVAAFEPHPYCLEQARSRGNADVRAGQLPNGIPFTPGSFDLVTALDVLEHLADDRSGLVALGHMLKPGGHIIATVPAFSFLWSEHDIRHHHYRRYTRKSLADLAIAAGLAEIRCNYFNTLLFPAVAGIRFAKNILHLRGATDDMLPPSPLNRLLTHVFAAERHLVGWLPLPFGTSLVMTAQYPSGQRAAGSSRT